MPNYSPRNALNTRMRGSGPQWLLSDIAAQFGVSRTLLQSIMANDPDAPRGLSRYTAEAKKRDASSICYYDLHAMQKWWKQYCIAHPSSTKEP